MTRTATVSVPATSANLGPGFDSLGLAIDIRDFVTATISDEPGVRVSIVGQGADTLPTNHTHLVAKTILDACVTFECDIVGLDIECKNGIPQGRGLGSSAAAIVAGLALARELSGRDITDVDLFQMANAIEGHPDNVAPALFGAMTIAWVEQDGFANSVSMNIHPDVLPILGVPATELSTKTARGLLPEQVPHQDAAFNAARSALLIAALIGAPDFLLEATDDRLHQTYRESAYPESMSLIHALRGQGIAACISGAGPSILALTTETNHIQACEAIAESGFLVLPIAVADEGVVVHETPQGQ